MRKSSFLLFVILLIEINFSLAQTNEVTTFYFIRHAEKIRNGDTDPELTKQGEIRAKQWAEILKDVKFDAVYTTRTKRTISTAEPTAKEHKIDIVEYDAKTIDIVQMAEIYYGKNVLFVGHSNTTPKLVNELIGKQEYKEIVDDNNGNLYIVTITKNKTTVTLLHFN